MFTDEAPNANVGLGFPNTGCVEAGPEDELNEKREPEDATLDDPNIVGALFIAAEAADAPYIAGELLVVLAAEVAPNIAGELLVVLAAEVAPNIAGELLVVLAAEVAPNENPVDGIELKPNMEDFGGCCQLAPNKLGVLLMLELIKLASGGEPGPGVVPELNGLAEVVELKGELPEERVVLPVNTND